MFSFRSTCAPREKYKRTALSVGKMWTWTRVSKLWNSDCIHEYIVHFKHSGKHCAHKTVICFPCLLLKQQKQMFKDWKLKNAKEHCWTDSEKLYKHCLLKTDVCDCLLTRKTHYSNKYANMNIKRSFSDQDLLLALKNSTKVSTEISTLLPCMKSTAGNVNTNTPHLVTRWHASSSLKNSIQSVPTLTTFKSEHHQY